MEISDVQSGLNDLLGLFSQIPDSLTTDINLSGDAISQSETLHSDLDTLNNEDISINADVVGNAEGDLTNLTGDVDNLNNMQLAIPVDATSLTELDGDANTAAVDIEGMGSAAEEASSTIVDAMTAADESINQVGSDASSAGGNISDMGSGAGTDTGTGTGTGTGLGVGIDAVGSTVGGIIGMAGLMEAQSALYDTNISIDKISTQTGIATGKMTDWVYAMTDAHFPAADAENYIEVLSQLGVPNEKLVDNAKAMNEIQIGTGASSASTIQFAADIAAMGGDLNNLSQYYGMAQYAQENVKGGMDAFATAARMLGPRLKDMGFTAEESAVIIADLSKKNAGNIRGMRKDLTDAHGSAEKLMGILGTTKGQVDQTSSSFTGLAGSTGESAQKLEHHADVTRANTSATQALNVTTDHATLATADWGGKLVGAAIPLGALTMGIGLASRALTKLKPEMTPSLWDVYWNMWRDAGKKVVDIIRGWGSSWGPEAEKSGQSIGKALEGGEAKTETFIGKLRNFGGKVWDNIKGWKTSWEGSAKNIDFVKDADGTFRMKSPGFIENVKGFGVKIGDTIRGWKFPKVNLGFLDDIGKGITSKLPDIRNIAGRVPTGVTEGITEKLPSLLGKAGGPAMIVTTVLQGLSGAGENWHKNIVQQTKEAFGIDMWQGLVWTMIPDNIKSFIAGRAWVFKLPFDSAVKFLGLDKLNISPEGFWTAIFGENAAKRFGDWLDTSISGPINHWFLDLPGKIVGWASGVPGAIEKPFNDAGDFLKNLPSNFMKWGGDAIQGLIDGIKSKIPGADGLDGALKQIGDHFPHSPPKTGALADITPGNMKSWMSTIADAGMKGFSDFKLNKVSLPSIPNISNSNISPNSVGSSQPINITADLTGLPSNTSDERAKSIGNNIGEGIGSNSILKGLISNGGKPNVIARK
jgi:hypothetical protein